MWAAYLTRFLEGFQGVHPAGHWPLIIGSSSPVQFAWNSEQQVDQVMVAAHRKEHLSVNI